MTAGRPSSWLWVGAPTLACVAAQLLVAVPVRVLGVAAPEPMFAMVPAFVWAAAGSSIVAPFILLVLGLYLDLLLGSPVGLWSVALLTTYGAAFVGRALLAGQGLAAYLAWYAGACGLGFAAAWFLAALEAHTAPNLVAVGWQFAATAALFPVAWRLTQRYEDADVRFR